MESASAETPAQMPIALPRSAAGKVLVMIERGADALDGAAADQHRRVLRDPRGGGGDREDDHAGHEHQPAAEDVPEPPAGGDQDGEGQRVAVDDPLQRRDLRVQVALDRRQGDVHDGVVEHHHEERETHRAERPPLAVVVRDQVPIASHRPTFLSMFE